MSDILAEIILHKRREVAINRGMVSEQELLATCRLQSGDQRRDDEISCADATEVVELNDGKISDYTIDPADFGLQCHALTTLVADTPADSARLLREGLAARNDAAATILMLNGGACLYAAAVCDDLGSGIALAGDLIYSGQALEKMSQFVEFTHTLSQLQGAAT